MGSGTSLHKRNKEITMENTQMTSQPSTDNQVASNELAQNKSNVLPSSKSSQVVDTNLEDSPSEEKPVLEFPESAEASLKEVTTFFTNEVVATTEWISQSGRTISQKLSNLSIYYENKKPFVRLNKEDRLKASELCLQYNIPQLIHTYLSYTLKNFPVIFKQDEDVLRKQKVDFNKEISSLKDADENNDVSELENKKKEVITLLHLQNILGGMMVASINCTDVSKDFGTKCCDINFVGTILENIDIYYPIITEEDKKDLIATKIKENGRTRILNYMLSTLHNIGKHHENRKYFEKNKCIEKMAPFIQACTTVFAMKTLLLLSHMITEDLAHVISATEEPIQVLLKYIKGAIKSDIHRHMGFSLSELIEGLGLMARNDDNKKTIGKLDGVNVLSLCLAFHLDGEEGMREIALTMKALWNLAFDESNKKIICEQGMIMTMLQEKEFTDKNIQKACAGVLWEVEGKMGRSGKVFKKWKDGSKKSLQKTDLGHIMISYQWDHQTTMLKVKEKVESLGYKVWIDVDQMGGSTLEAMASAVEDSFLILMTVSQKYKDSANCRSEAEYAFQLKKNIIPMMLEPSYKADGWLGFIVGAKYWIDFTDNSQTDISLDSLVKEINKHFQTDKEHSQAAVGSMVSMGGESNVIKQDLADVEDGLTIIPTDNRRRSTITSLSISEAVSNRTNVHEWTSKEVKEWLKSVGLYEYLDTKARKDLNGFVLKHLQELRSESADTFYRLIKEDLGIYELVYRFKFADELKYLFQ